MFPSVGTFFRRLVHIFYLFLLFFNDFDLFPYRFLGVYFKKPSEFNDVSKKVESPNQTKPTHNMADDFGISELVTFAPGFARAALRVAARELQGEDRKKWPPMKIGFLDYNCVKRAENVEKFINRTVQLPNMTEGLTLLNLMCNFHHTNR